MALREGHISIGEAARLSGVTAKALRHYHQAGLLVPDSVDAETGYRYYTPEQVDLARRVRVLRRLHLSLEEIEMVLGAPGSPEAIACLQHHRNRIFARLADLQSAWYFIGELLNGEEIDSVMPARPEMISIQQETQRALAAELFNHVWTLLEKEDRSQREDDMMVAAAYASRFLWERAGTAVNHARGEWQISRACAVAGRPEEALLHAERCLQICEQEELSAFDEAYAHEALARAAELRGDSPLAAAHAARARDAAAGVTDADERELLQGDLATLPV